jgi:hypothetical protein
LRGTPVPGDLRVAHECARDFDAITFAERRLVTDTAAKDRANETSAIHVVDEPETRLRNRVADTRALRQIERDERLLRYADEGDLYAHVMPGFRRA